MSLTIELTRTEEDSLRGIAAENGTTAENLLQEVVRGHLSAGSLPRVTREQTLLSKLTQRLPAELWRRYHELDRKLRDERAGEQERQEFLRLNQQVEAWNVERIQLLGEVSKIRGLTLEETMKQLGVWREPEY